MNLQTTMNRIAILLSRFTESVRILNANGEFDINIHAENALVKMLKVIFDTDFDNVNYSESKHYPAIDLRDVQKKSATHKRIAIQVTADESLDKVKDCISTFMEKGMDADFDLLYIVILGKKQRSYSQNSIDKIRYGFNFDVKEHILDLADLYVLLNSRNNLAAAEEVRSYLDMQFADGFDYDKHRKYCSNLAEYDQNIIRQYEYLDISGYSPRINTLQVKVGINDLYVNQLLKYRDENRDVFVPLSRLLSPGEKSVILGDPGVGKSTLLKWLMYDICSHRSHYSSIVPVYIKCSTYAQKIKQSYQDLAAFILQCLNLKNESVYLDALSDGHLFLMLDGLDEISDVSLRHEVVECINMFISQNPNCRVVATSRKIGYNETRLDAHFTHYELPLFTKTQIGEFVRNWYHAVDPTQYSNETSESFLGQLQQSKSVYELAKTPLLLTIICLIRYQGLSLPENRIELFSITTSTLLDNWVKKHRNQQKVPYSIKTLISLLAPVAFYMQEHCDDGIISEDAFREQLLRIYARKSRGKSDIDIEQDVDSLITYIKEDAGFLREVGFSERCVGQFSFIHLTFQEYFASIHMLSKWRLSMDKSELAKYVLAPYWSEVMALTAEQLFETDADEEVGCQYVSELVEQILDIDDIVITRNRPLDLVIHILQGPILLNDDLLHRISKLLLADHNHPTLLSSIIKKGASRIFFISELVDAYYTSPTDTYIVELMMRHSNEPAIHDALLNVLCGDNIPAKKELFRYRIIYPVSQITQTAEFRASIIDFVNSTSCDRIPTQYTISLISESEAIVPQMIDAVRAIKSPAIRQSYASELHREVLWHTVENLEEYENSIRQEFPDIDTTSLKLYIAKQKKKNSAQAKIRDVMPIIQSYIAGFEIYYSTADSSLVVHHSNEVYTLKSPYVFEKHLLPSIIEMDDFQKFINLIVSWLTNQNVKFKNSTEFDLFYKYSHLLDQLCIRRLNITNKVFAFFFTHIGGSPDNVRKYIKIFQHRIPGDYFSMTQHQTQLDTIIHSDLLAVDKIKVLSCVEIPRKHRNAVKRIINEHLSTSDPHDWKVRNAVNSVMQRI